MSNNYLIDIVIVNYKSTDFLIKCLHSIYSELDRLQANIYIQDNSCDDNVDRIKKIFPEVFVTKNDQNIGFSAAVNKALTQGESPYVVLLNPDSTINKGFFKYVLEFMDENPNVGILGPKILNHDGTVQGSARAFPTPITGFFGRTSLLTKLFPNNWITRRTILTTKINGTSPVEVDWVSGACMVIRRDIIDEVGMMDEQFFMYWEDVDWCRRMWQKGWKVVYYPKASIIHQVGGSSDQRPIKSIYNFHISCYLYFIKYPSWPAAILKPIALLGLSLRFFISLLIHYFPFYPSRIEQETPKILFLITEDWYFWSHRLPIARAVRDNGYDVVIATRVHLHRDKILNEGFTLVPLRLERRSKNVFKELRDFFEIIKLYSNEKPNIVHHVGIKPVLYGSWAARITGIPSVVNALAGLGFIFIAKGRKSEILRKFVEFGYRSAFSHKNAIGIFQNPEDLNQFVNRRIVDREDTVLIRGSGVNTSDFVNLPETNGLPRVVLASRMLWDKGVGEFVAAAKLVNKNGTKCKFVLVGDPDPENPMTIPEDTLRKWHNEGVIEWLGHRKDIPEIFAQANIVSLPSYREGLPKVLLEAASCGRAIVATDVPGCNEIVRNNENGFLVPPYQSKPLADAIIKLINNPELRSLMGKRSREIVETEFKEEIVIEQTMAVYKSLLS